MTAWWFTSILPLKKSNQPTQPKSKKKKSWRKYDSWETSRFGYTSMPALSKEILIMLMSSALAFELPFFFFFLISRVFMKAPFLFPSGVCVKRPLFPASAEPRGTVPLWWQPRGALVALTHQHIAAVSLSSRPFLVIREQKIPSPFQYGSVHTGTPYDTCLFMINGNRCDPMHKLVNEYEALSGTPLRLHRKF